MIYLCNEVLLSNEGEGAVHTCSDTEGPQNKLDERSQTEKNTQKTEHVRCVLDLYEILGNAN